MKNTRQMFLSLLVMLTLLFSSFGAIHVYADDATPVPEATEEAVVEEGSSEAPPEAQATEEAAANPTEEPAETEPAADEESGEATPEATEESSDPTEEPTEETPAEETADPTEEAEASEEPTAEPTPDLSDEELDTLPEILENVPQGTEVVVLDADGNPASMASEQAAETLVEGDPMWCPEGVTPIANTGGCTDSYGTFAELIDVLEADADLGTPLYSANGIIYVSDSYNGNDGHQINISGTELTQLRDYSLTIQGGWDDGSADDGVSNIDVSFSINNWLGDIFLYNLVIANTTDEDFEPGFGLHVETAGTVTMNNVSASGSTTTLNNTRDGAIVFADNGINISNSTFSDNDFHGLWARSSAGDIVLNNVTAEDNKYTGIYLDTCVIDTNTGLCTASGNVTVNGGTVTGNQFNGVQISSGRSTEVNVLNSSSNSLSGLVITSGTEGVANTVEINGGIFNGNIGGTGIRINQYGDGDVTLQSTLQAVGNRYGTTIYNTTGTGNVSISNSIFAGSIATGLHVESNGNITLTGVEAGSGTFTGNGSNGAYLIADGDILVSNSSFNENVNSNFPADPGIFAKAGGNITLLTVTANNNAFGPGAILKTTGAGDILVSAGSVFNQNGSFGVQATSSVGSITLSDTSANLNAVKGAYLDANGAGNILIQGGTFNENGSYGIYGSADEGDITVMMSMFDGAGVTGTGAKFIAENGGEINLLNPTFQNNEIGAYLVGEANMTLTDVVADANTAYGVKMFSTFTQKGCYCPGDENTSIIATIENGTFQNSEVGIYAKPGEEGSVTFTGTQTFFNITVDDYILDTDPIPECSDCNCEKEEKESKPYNVIEVPFSGSGNVPQQCDIYAGTVLQMENGVVVKVRCPFEGFSNLQGVNFTDLPGILDEDMYELGILLGLLGEDGSFVLNSDGTITLTFTIPENTRGRAHQLLFWDTSMNDGAGGWIEMPPFEHGTSFMLHPDDPEDPRMIVSGVVNNGKTMSITVNFAGYFVVVGE